MKKTLNILFISLFIFSCDNDSIRSSEGLDNYIYPINLNNNWVYNGEFTRVDSLGVIDSIIFSSNIVVIVDSIYNEMDNIYRFKSINVEDETEIGYHYISNSEEGLLYHGNKSFPSLVIPWVRNSNIFYKINEEIFSINEFFQLLNQGNNVTDDICWDDTPKISIKYPVNIDEQWFYRDSTWCSDDGNESPWRMDKLVIEKTNETFTIQTLYDLNEDSIWDEDIKVYHTYSRNGLINYRVETYDQIMTDEFGIYLGTYTNIYNSNLIGSEVY